MEDDGVLALEPLDVPVLAEPLALAELLGLAESLVLEEALPLDASASHTCVVLASWLLNPAQDWSNCFCACVTFCLRLWSSRAVEAVEPVPLREPEDGVDVVRPEVDVFALEDADVVPAELDAPELFDDPALFDADALADALALALEAADVSACARDSLA